MKCKKDGCRASAMKGNDYCYFHNPDIADKRKEGQANGGSKSRLNLDDITEVTPESMSKALLDALNSLRRSSKAERVAQARGIAYIVSVMNTVVTMVDFETRLSRLEKALQVKGDFDYLDNEDVENEYDREAVREARS